MRIKTAANIYKNYSKLSLLYIRNEEILINFSFKCPNDLALAPYYYNATYKRTHTLTEFSKLFQESVPYFGANEATF